MTTGLGFDDESLGFSLLSALVIGLEVGVFQGQTPGDGEELVLSRKLLSETHQPIA